jgi:hypothetical protein
MNRYTGHYKSVESPEEFFSEKRDTLDFPTQVTYKSKRYLLFTTLLVSTTKQEENIIEMAKSRNIEYGVKLD